MRNFVDKEFEVLIGQAIRHTRRRKRVTQDALADRLNISSQQVQKYEKADSRISASSLLKIAMFLGEPIETFFKDARAHLEGEQIALEPIRSANDETIYGYGFMVQNISDPAFKKTLIALIRRHNEAVTKVST